ncbi:MAG: heme biosynthesis protein HemY [Methylomonas sp.]|nr:MAG: heme biosynthesis protein HemY [Methylobacter sp.]PPD37063.1 MAG: heme biosynthesis protein HemY [Methylomonas sp.]
MKKLLYYLTPPLLAVIAAVAVNKWLESYGSSGYVLIGFGNWSLETSFVVFAVASIIAFCLFYMFFRFLGWLIKLPGKIKKRGKSIKFNRSQEALIAGLVNTAEGNWEQAEKVLIKHASHSGAPLLHYLTAAKAAQSRGAFDKRDEYLRAAADQAPGSDIAIGLTQAELHLSGQQFEQAIETLTKLHSINPTHASVLKLMHQAYQRIGDWEGLRKLIPSLNTNKVLMEAEIKLLETETFSQLLKQTAQTKDPEQIAGLWAEVPSHIKTMQGIPAIYFASMINAGAGNRVEDGLSQTLPSNWEPTLLVLYANIQSDDPATQLNTAERWLAAHPSDAVLMWVLGKLCLALSETVKAEKYLTQSLAIEPSVRAYQLLGELCLAQGDKDRACECYKQALELASNEVVNLAETMNPELRA